MAVRATIIVIRSEADTKYVSPSASINNVNAEAIAFVNPDSKNQWFYDTYALGDINVLVVNKNLSEVIPLVEKFSWDFRKDQVEAVSLVESFVKAVTYNRSFTDAFTLDDLSQIDKDFYGNKGNVAFITDIIGLDHNKVLADSYTVSDVIELAITYVREYSDSTTIVDSNYLDFYGNKIDALNLSETQVKEFSTSKQESVSISDSSTIEPQLNKTEAVSIADTYSKALAKFVTDTFVLDDSALIDKDFYGNKGNVVGLTEVISQGIAKNLTEITTISDVYKSSLEKPINETLSFSDSVVSSIVKTIADAFTLDDSALIDKDYFGNKGNVIGLTEIVEQGISKIEAEIIAITDVPAIGFNRPESETINISDVSLLSYNLGKLETVTLSEDYYKGIAKNIADGFALDDTTLINKDVDTTKGNVLGFTDVFTRVVAYSRSIADSLSFSDVLTIASVFNRTYADSLTISDTKDAHLNKVLDEAFSVRDKAPTSDPLGSNIINAGVINFQSKENPLDFNLSSSLGATESVNFAEITKRYNTKVLAETLTFSDQYGLQLNKNILDVFTLDDSALVDKNFYGNKGNVVSVNDLVSITKISGGLFNVIPLNVATLN